MSKVLDSRKELVDRLIEQMKEGKLVWDAGHAQLAFGLNPTTGKQYRGGNIIRLKLSSVFRNFKDPRWMTFKQGTSLGYKLKKGSKGTLLEKYQPPEYKKEIDENGDLWLSNVPEKPGFIKGFYVFNAEQFENMPALDMKEYDHGEQDKIFASMLERSEAKIYLDELTRNYYRLDTDEIHVMDSKFYKDIRDWYGTVVHEIGHSTGHESRLDRPMKGRFGSIPYAKEELRAELTSAMLCQEFGFQRPEHEKNNAAYLQSWIQVLKNDPNELFRAAADASRAVDYIKEHMMDKTLLRDFESARLPDLNKEAEKEKTQLSVSKPTGKGLER